MGKIDRFVRRLVLGEMRAPDGMRIAGSNSWTLGGRYPLDATRVDYELARRLYRNTDPNFRLGSAFAKPIVNTMAGFMGVPRFTHIAGDDRAQQFLEDGFRRWTGKLLRGQRNGIRDGDLVARLDLQSDRFDDRAPDEIVLNTVAPETFTPIHNPITGELQEVLIAHPVRETRRVQGSTRIEEVPQYHIIEIITPTERTFEIDGPAPRGTHEMLELMMAEEGRSNPWGFIPIVHFKNDAEDNQVYGSSELEPVYPFIKAYHEVMRYAVEGAKLFARPKATFNVEDVGAFLENNFSAEELESGRVRFSDKEIMFFTKDESATFLTAESGMAGTTTLLEFLFYCIVDVSQTPEFAFGTAVASSKASVSEQMPVLQRNIARKRGEFEDPYKELASMYLAMASSITAIARPESYRVEIAWDEVSPEDESSVATTIQTYVSAMREAVESGLISHSSAVEFLAEHVPSMLPFVDEDAPTDERRKIIEGKSLLDQLEAGTASDLDNGENDDDRGDVLPFPLPAGR